MLSIKIEGLDKLIQGLGSIEKAHEAIEPVLSRWAERIGTEWHTYPPTLPNQRYRRTGRLRRGRRQLVQRRRDGIAAIARNEGVPYSGWVLRDSTQANVHRGRWQTDEGLARKYERAIAQDVEEAIAKRLEG